MIIIIIIMVVPISFAAVKFARVVLIVSAQKLFAGVKLPVF